MGIFSGKSRNEGRRASEIYAEANERDAKRIVRNQCKDNDRKRRGK